MDVRGSESGALIQKNLKLMMEYSIELWLHEVVLKTCILV